METAFDVLELPDEILARRAAEGKPDDFEAILSRYRDRVYRICYRMAGNAEDAEDWAQECLVRVYRQLGRYDPELPFAPWLMRVVANTCINLARARTRRQEKVELGLDEESEAISLVMSSTPVASLMATMLRCWLSLATVWALMVTPVRPGML